MEAAWVPDMFHNFYLVKNQKISHKSTTDKAREKISTYLESFEFWKFLNFILSGITLSVVMLSFIWMSGIMRRVIMLSVIRQLHFAECRYAECHCSECH